MNILLTSMRLAIALGALVLIAVSPAGAVQDGYLMLCEVKQVHAILGNDGTVRPRDHTFGFSQWNKIHYRHYNRLSTLPQRRQSHEPSICSDPAYFAFKRFCRYYG